MGEGGFPLCLRRHVDVLYLIMFLFCVFIGSERCAERSPGKTGNKQPPAQNEQQSSLLVSVRLFRVTRPGAPMEAGISSPVFVW